MIRQLHINNYKSLFDLTLEVGRFNVLIGENGCGKSNVLEAIALAGAAAANKLDNEFLTSRGVRVADPQLMCSAFKDKNLKDVNEMDSQELIKLVLELTDCSYDFYLYKDNKAYSTWKKFNSKEDYLKYRSDRSSEKSLTFLEIVKINNPSPFMTYAKLPEFFEFIIYSPENTALRNFSKEGQIEPLGINGEGLLKLLKVIQSKSPEQLEEIHTCLQLFDWFDEIDIPKELSSVEDKVTISDRYLAIAFDQRSANEGFLFVLFYIALMVSDDTPKIFAVDNIDVALNPKLCTKLIKELVRLAKKYDKQVFVTTHNPAILDGIDLGDDEQRLLVLSRNKQGHTRVKRIELKDKPRSSTDEELNLSEAFLRGYLGGLPKGF